MSDTVLIAGGGIAGLSLALTLHQIGVRARVFESARQMLPLGVGVNLQPNAVRELFDLGLGAEVLDRVGVPAQEWALVGLNGREVYAEPRGRYAGYHWPQYAVHRGAFHMALYQAVVDRLGADAVVLGAKVTGYTQTDAGVSAQITHVARYWDLVALSDRTPAKVIGADGIHSRVRAQMHPKQPPIHWGGAIMWRGTVRAKPLRTGSSFVGLGTHRHRIVFYPISAPDADGLAEINWIAEVTLEDNHQSGISAHGRPQPRLAARRLVPPCRDRGFRPSLRGFPLRLAGCARDAARGRLRLRKPDDRPRSARDMGFGARGADGGCGPSDVSHGIEWREPSHCRWARLGCDDAGTWGDARGLGGL